MNDTLTPSRIIIVMGVSSSGKSSTGRAIARRLHAPFLDGDDYHSAENKAKMAGGTPLTDADRWPWLTSLAQALHEAAEGKGVAVGACSALKRSYRDKLASEAGEPILFVFLEGTRDVIAARMAARRHEYMPLILLDSQFATLEPPTEDENVLTVDVSEPTETIAERVVRALPHLKSFRRKQ